MAEKAILKIGDKDYELPVIEGTEKEKKQLILQN